MERVKTWRVYNLLDANGNKLLLRLGYTVDERGTPNNGNAGWRCSFEGKTIPMPVRSRTWFCGFPEQTMISWLKGNGWYVRARVDMGCGKADVYELPKANEDDVDCLKRKVVVYAVERLWSNGNKTDAVALYRHYYGGSVCKAQAAVREIVDREK